MNLTGTVADISDERLIERAVRNARKKRQEPKWSAVANAFGLGSTYSMQLCRRFGIDPDTGKDTPDIVSEIRHPSVLTETEIAALCGGGVRRHR